jgi:hypothetical protein
MGFLQRVVDECDLHFRRKFFRPGGGAASA